ncbi:MAG: hypothetical protein HC895_12400 [Leptolyngbyaceae cyanobacterium SM1_3_5]|nr:hypothetical protein [Leptolyngbyaceae cyanobacterium SM1_3_5]
MPYPVPPPPPLLIQIAAPSETVAAPAITAPSSFEPERQPENPLHVTEAALLGGAIERSAAPTPPAVSLTFSTRQAQLPTIPTTPAVEVQTPVVPEPASSSPSSSSEPSTAESESFELFEPPSAPSPEDAQSEPSIESPPPPAENPPIETIRIDPTEENPEGQTLEIIPEPAPEPASEPTPEATEPPSTTNPGAPPAETQTDPSGTGGIVELDADYQEFDTIREILRESAMSKCDFAVPF